ncbi:hypothetical protein [Saccharopolyspora pogona]|uniref:hypothetical protein n=1 Tax=Saccharopolyspora pogona TaxID=333966 RepID=UPI001683C661|nr:hypothetical protein [Saccharopolyspora pogona]
MTAVNSPRDLQLSDDGKWEPYDVSGGASDVTDVGDYLESQGWSPYLRLGAGEWASLNLLTWQRDQDGRSEYLIAVSNQDQASEYLKVSSLPTLMDLLARWAPAVQAASIADVVQDLHEPLIEHEGIVETIAARAVWGVQDRLPRLRSYRQTWDAVEAEARATRQEPLASD